MEQQNLPATTNQETGKVDLEAKKQKSRNRLFGLALGIAVILFAALVYEIIILIIR